MEKIITKINAIQVWTRTLTIGTLTLCACVYLFCACATVPPNKRLVRKYRPYLTNQNKLLLNNQIEPPINSQTLPAIEKIDSKQSVLKKTSDDTAVENEDITDKESVDMPEVSLTAKEKKINKRYHTIISKASKLYQVDQNLIKAVIMTESSYNPKAVSDKGAKGLMQLMPGTAKELGVNDCFNPAQNIHGGVRYLRKLLNKFNGDIELALAAYNAGSSRVMQYDGIPPFKETRKYIQKVVAYYDSLNKIDRKSKEKATGSKKHQPYEITKVKSAAKAVGSSFLAESENSYLQLRNPIIIAKSETEMDWQAQRIRKYRTTLSKIDKNQDGNGATKFNGLNYLSKTFKKCASIHTSAGGH